MKKTYVFALIAVVFVVLVGALVIQQYGLTKSLDGSAVSNSIDTGAKNVRLHLGNCKRGVVLRIVWLSIMLTLNLRVIEFFSGFQCGTVQAVTTIRKVWSICASGKVKALMVSGKLS